MNQNPQINIPTNGNDSFFNANDNIYCQSSNILCNNVNATCNYDYGFSMMSAPVLNANTPITSDGNYGNSASSTDVMDASSSLSFLPINPPNITFSRSEIIRYEIPGYDVIFIPKPSPIVQQDRNFLNNPSLVTPTQQNYVYSVDGTSSSANTNAINSHNNQFTITDKHQYQHQQQSSLGLNGSFSNFNNFRG